MGNGKWVKKACGIDNIIVKKNFLFLYFFVVKKADVLEIKEITHNI